MLTITLCSPVAFFASFGRGYLPPMGFAIVTLIMAQFIAYTGLGPYFPWAIPGLYIVASGEAGMQVVPISFFILYGTCIAGMLATFGWWRLADQN